MPDRVTEFGVQMYRSPVTAVRELKAVGPLRPTTVLVASEQAGVAARRVLGAGDGQAEVAAVRLFTLRRRAETSAGPELTGQGRLPITASIAPTPGQIFTIDSREQTCGHRDGWAVTLCGWRLDKFSRSFGRTGFDRRRLLENSS